MLFVIFQFKRSHFDPIFFVLFQQFLHNKRCSLILQTSNSNHQIVDLEGNHADHQTTTSASILFIKNWPIQKAKHLGKYEPSSSYNKELHGLAYQLSCLKCKSHPENSYNWGKSHCTVSIQQIYYVPTNYNIFYCLVECKTQATGPDPMAKYPS